MPNNIITSLYYVSPYATFPPGISVAGITLQADTSQVPPGITNPVLVIRLRPTTSPNPIGMSPTSGVSTSVGSATYQPPFPLSGTESYMVDAIWVPNNTPPGNIDWHSAVASAPVTATAIRLEEASYDGTNVTARVIYGASSIGVGAQVAVYALSAGVLVNVGQRQTESAVVTVPVTSGFAPPYYIYAQAVTPATNAAAQGSFAAPFSLGPPSAPKIVPQAVKALVGASYDGVNLALNWALDTLDGCPAPQSSQVEILATNNILATFTGGPLAANFPVDVGGQSGITARIQTVADGIASAPLAAELITGVPSVSDVAASASTVTANVAPPEGTQLNVQGYLTDGSTVLAGPVAASGGQLRFSYNAVGYVGLSVVAQALSGDAKTLGPRSAPVPLLATEPVLESAEVYTDPSDSNKWRIDCYWQRLPDAAKNITSYTVSAMQETSTLATSTLIGTSATLSIAKSDVDPAKPQTIQLLATGTSGGNSPASSQAILFSAPELASVDATTNQIAASWTAPAAIPSTNTQTVRYQIVVQKNGAAVYEGSWTSAMQGAVALGNIPLSAADQPSVLVNVRLGPVLLRADAGMGTKCSATPILDTPVIGAVSTDSISNKSILNWAEVTGASTYTLSFTQGETHSGVTGHSYTLPVALSAGEQLGYRVQGVGTSNSVPLTGPTSDLDFVPSDAANMASLRFDGAKVTATWQPVDGATGYKVFVYDNAEPPVNAYSGSTAGTSLTFAINASADKTYTAYVQPIIDGGEGLTGATLSLFTTAYFLSKEPSSTASPYVYPATKMATLGSASGGPVAEAVTLYLPELGTAAGALGSAAITVEPFTLEPSGDASLPYKLTIVADDTAWKFGTDAIRSTLQSAYVDFLKKLETPPGGGDGVTGATPYGIHLVQTAIGRLLPQTFDELLYYNFGFSTVSSSAAGYVDLRPGMVLRAVIGDYVNISQYDMPSWITGYAGAAVMDFDIGSYSISGHWRTGFDAFMSTLAAEGVLHVDPPAQSTNSVQAGVAAAADLYYPQFVQPFYRLFFPDKVLNPTGIGSNATSSNFTLAAAANYTSLLTTDTDPANTATAYFRGRTILQVMQRVILNGTERLVPMGTSVGNLLDQVGLRPAASSPVLSELRVHRSIQPALTSLPPAQSLGPAMEIRFDWQGFASYSDGNGSDPFSMPLLPGDRIDSNG